MRDGTKELIGYTLLTMFCRWNRFTMAAYGTLSSAICWAAGSGSRTLTLELGLLRRSRALCRERDSAPLDLGDKPARDTFFSNSQFNRRYKVAPTLVTGDLNFNLIYRRNEGTLFCRCFVLSCSYNWFTIWRACKVKTVTIVLSKRFCTKHDDHQ